MAPWSIVSLRVFEALTDVADTGVRIIQITEYADHPIVLGRWAEGVTSIRLLEPHEVPDTHVAGMTMTVPQIDPTIYLPWLEGQLRDAGGGIGVLGAPLTDLAPLFAEAAVVVNCSGLGAHDLVGDTSMFPIRGQVVAVRDTAVTEGRIDESGGADITYVFPRRHEVILGGIRWKGDWSDAPDDGQTARILDSAKVLYPGLSTDDVVEVRVGLRPGRDTVRLETEITPAGPVVHNYGHSGNGYILSWGCAQAVSAEVAVI